VTHLEFSAKHQEIATLAVIEFMVLIL